MEIITDKPRGVTAPKPSPHYRSRLRKQAQTLLQRQQSGGFLGNQQKRLLRRWQRIEAQSRATEQNAQASQNRSVKEAA
ncbi:hypothetical protein [Stenomitos frigidus]|uniref:Uncharacterized protein n=1 Tax=Stenomitos frigidus ULC18 TaxID=2107698 RepID=A0A2T1EBT3_9CYAN|nr:hypothetical protein [Stenomitos frigidus]PSB30171.1 hypothetical protein C7B82_09455 [Stenomitos frigidus ULC18]